LIDGIYVFDNVIHAYDMSDENLRPDRDDAATARAHMVGALGPPRRQRPEELTRAWLAEDMYSLVFEQSSTDLAMAQVVPIYDWYTNWFAPVNAQYEMARKYPDRVLFCGGVDPNYEGLDAALRALEHQITEMGARSIKFYNGHVEGSWSCDDPEVAYPLYEKCLELGVDVVQFHKGIPFGDQNMETLRPNDLQKAARDFPAMKFIIHHLAYPYVDETISIAARFPNIYLALSGTVSLFMIAPVRMQHIMGRLLYEVGNSKLLWGSEAALVGSPEPYLRTFMDLTISDELMDGYGYPQITRADKEAILGQNFARMLGMDLAKTVASASPIPGRP
jgi:predicted TIM-barrel fold metal-dependent hydrolase